MMFFPYNTKSDALTNVQAGLFHGTETYSDQGLSSSKNDENENKALSMNCEYMSYIYSGYGKYSDPLKFFTLCYIAAIC